MLWRFRGGRGDMIAATRQQERSMAFTGPVMLAKSSLFSYAGTALHGTLGYFSEGIPLAYLLATVVTGLGLLVGSHVYMSGPEQVAHQSDSVRTSNPQSLIPNPSPKTPFVGRITGMADCKWNGASRVSLGQKYELASGLMEITYDTGARVTLQGPVRYEVEANGGYLSLGKLTGKLARNDECRMMNDELRTRTSGIHHSSFIVHRSSNPQSLIPNPFVIHTPTATVTDLGTEFGVEVGRDGACEVHVIQGRVRAEPADCKSAAANGVVLSSKQAVRFNPNKPGYTSIPAAPARFQALQTGMVRTPPLRWPLLDRTLVAWVSLANTRQRGACALSVTNMFQYDGIVFGELEPGKWMAGSDQHARTQKDQSQCPVETAEPGELVQIAIVYTWESITIYRNGRKYAEYDPGGRPPFNNDSFLLIGNGPRWSPTLAGAIEEARVYNVVLSPQMIASLRPNEPSPIGPVGQWTFEDGTARDVTGHFPMGLLQGKARIADGKLILDGQGSFLVVPPTGGVKEPTPVSSSDFEQDLSRWFGQYLSGDRRQCLHRKCFLA